MKKITIGKVFLYRALREKTKRFHPLYETKL